ncbi:MAG: YbgC/FadM family acyl-CoA thioesterase [Maricaulaceae bacterium]
MALNNHNTLGWFEGRTHCYPLHIFYEDTDFSGLVYHANYLRYFERGRSSFLKLIGVAHSELWQDYDIAFTIRKFEIEYKAPAKIDDHLLIKTTYDKITGARLLISQECLKGDKLIARANCEAAVISKSGRPVRLPNDIKSKIDAFTQENS